MEEDDDFYGDDSTTVTKKEDEQINGEEENKDEKMDESLEEGEEEEDSDDSDIEIITESKDAPAPELSRGGSFNQSFNKSEPARTASADPSKAQGSAHAAPSSGANKSSAPSAPQKPGSAYPEVRTSTVDVNGNPVYEALGKPITEVDIDADLQEHDKPWRLPGADQSDYFNYGFDEFTWTLYCLKQRRTADDIKSSKGEMGAQMAQFEMLFGGMPPGMTGAPTGPAANGPPVGAPTGPAAQQGAAGGPQGGAQNGPGAAAAAMMGMPPMDDNMMQMLQQFRAQGIDPSQLSFEQMMQMMQGGMPQGPAAGQQAGFGAQGGQQGQFGGGYQGGFRGGRGGRRW
ncbi:Fip1 motif-domain-containing protein [Phyllosticta citricarpa]|uniref:Fip1 motif-domain-containing protein n=2 Tax=Phyllosticta TaxID=121621 RepID=A0ABR1M6N0_9PEZI